LSSRQKQRQQAQHALQLLSGGFDNLLTEDDMPLADNVIAAVAADVPSQLLEPRPVVTEQPGRFVAGVGWRCHCKPILGSGY
jgi:outer membrane protein TolC